jgi:hypothetical protein
MSAVVIYESMYGNTHLIADAIGAGIGDDTRVVPVDDATPELVREADLIVVGGPTHVHGMSRASTRKAAVEAAQKPDSDLEVDPDAEGPGLREWFADLGELAGAAAAFDTRIDAPPAFTGRASKGIAKQLRTHGARLVVDPESFLVTKESHLEPHEEERARAWGATLRAAMVSAAT